MKEFFEDLIDYNFIFNQKLIEVFNAEDDFIFYKR